MYEVGIVFFFVIVIVDFIIVDVIVFLEEKGFLGFFVIDVDNNFVGIVISCDMCFEIKFE